MFDRKAHLARARASKRRKGERTVRLIDALEHRYYAYRAARRGIESLMRQELGTGRPTIVREHGDEGAIVGGMSILASVRPRVADSFDARPASARSTARPYSGRQAAKDASRSSRAPRRSIIGRDGKAWTFECVSVKPDGTRVPFAGGSERASKTRRAVERASNRVSADRALMAAMASIHV